MNVLVFDIETIPDALSGQRLYNLAHLTQIEAAEFMREKRRQETDGSDFLRHHLHRIVAISAVLSTSDRIKVWSLGDVTSDESELIQRFFDGIDKYTPVLVSWNGSGFDLPVIHYRALLHGISAPRYWDTGEDDSSFRWNNYLSRYHYRHMDLMDILAGYQSRACAPLQEIAIMLGLPGKLGMDGGQVWEAYQKGELTQIRNYCETDVLNTYLVYLRFELIRGKITTINYKQRCQQLKEFLEQASQPHFEEFLTAWKKD